MAEGTFTKLERYELKYHIPLAMVGKIARFLEPWCKLDDYSTKSADHFYWVSSLYLDSPRHTFFRWKEEGLENRFNMRVRTYGQNPAVDGPRFYEVKHKRADIVEKTRGTLLGGHAERLWTDTENVMAHANPKEKANLELFLRNSLTYNASPVLLTQYRRIAWFGIHEDYARVTIDTGLRWREENGFDYTVDPQHMRATDNSDYFRPGTNAVLELKCPRSEVPWWMLDLIRYLNLERGSFSKFGSAMCEYLRAPTSRVQNSFQEYSHGS